MKLRILSDLHLESRSFSIPALPSDAQSVLVLAGDTGPLGIAACASLVEDLLREACARFRSVIFICGNHEFYGGVWPTERRRFMARRDLPPNLHILERESVTLNDTAGPVTFFGATLWTDYDHGDPFAMHEVEYCLSDYRAIRTEGVPDAYGRASGITPSMILKYHRETVDWMMEAMPKARARGERTVLVTHHAMSHQSIHPRFEGSEANSGFVSDEEDVLTYVRPTLAIHGHTHDSFDYQVGGRFGEPAVRVVANPRGYCREGDMWPENRDFDPTLVIEI